MSEHSPEGKHRFPPNNLESCTLGVGHLSTGLQHLDRQGIGREREMEKQNKIWTVKGKYPSRFYSSGSNCVSSLLPVWSLIPHLWVQASGTTDRAEDFFFVFLTCSSVNWKKFEIGIMSGLGFHVVDNSVSFQNECWSLGIPEYAQQCKRTSVIRWARVLPAW